MQHAHIQWRIQKILVGGDLKHKTSKIRMSSPKLRLIFRPKSDIQTFFSPKFRWSPKKKKKKKKKKKRSSPKLRLIFRPKSEIQTFFSPKFRWSPKKKKNKKKKRSNFSAEIGNSNVLFAQIQVVSKKKKKKKKKKKRSSPKLRLIFRPKSEIQTFFSPKFRWSPKKKKKKKKKKGLHQN